MARRPVPGRSAVAAEVRLPLVPERGIVCRLPACTEEALAGSAELFDHRLMAGQPRRPAVVLSEIAQWHFADALLDVVRDQNVIVRFVALECLGPAVNQRLEGTGLGYGTGRQPRNRDCP